MTEWGKKGKWPVQIGLSIKTLQGRSPLFGYPTDLRWGWFTDF